MCIRDSFTSIWRETVPFWGVYIPTYTINTLSLSTDEGGADNYLPTSTDNNENLGPFSCHRMKGFSSVGSISCFRRALSPLSQTANLNYLCSLMTVSSVFTMRFPGVIPLKVNEMSMQFRP